MDTRTKINRRLARAVRAENFAPGAATLCGLRTDPGRRALAQEGLSVSRETLRQVDGERPAYGARARNA